MNLKMGNQTYQNVQIPLLWGKRAILQNKRGQISIIDLSGETAHIEVLADGPAPNVAYVPHLDGIVILRGKVELYHYNPEEKVIRSIGLGLPDLEISDNETRVGSTRLSGNMFSGSDVGIAVSKDGGIAIGGSLPPDLAKLAF